MLLAGCDTLPLDPPISFALPQPSGNPGFEASSTPKSSSTPQARSTPRPVPSGTPFEPIRTLAPLQPASALPTPKGMPDVSFEPGSGPAGTILAYSREADGRRLRLHRSQDHGTSWQELATVRPANGLDRFFAQHPSEPDIFYLVMQAETPHGSTAADWRLFRTYDAGTS